MNLVLHGAVFQVREHPMYLLIKARILKKQGDLQEAINCLKAAMALPGVRAGGGKLIGLPPTVFLESVLAGQYE